MCWAFSSNRRVSSRGQTGVAYFCGLMRSPVGWSRKGKGGKRSCKSKRGRMRERKRSCETYGGSSSKAQPDRGKWKVGHNGPEASKDKTIEIKRRRWTAIGPRTR